MINVAVLVAIDKTPVPGLDVHFEGVSSTAATPPARTDEAGVASQLVHRSDTITIFSGLDAVQFQRISGPASALHAIGVVEVDAWRLVEPAQICRFLDAANQDSLAFYVNNIAAQILKVPRREPLSSLHGPDGILTELQPPETFEPGVSFFTMLTRAFVVDKDGNVCSSGTWKLLGVEKKFRCIEGQAEIDLPFCEVRSELPCMDPHQEELARVRRALANTERAIRLLEADLKARYPQQNGEYSVAGYLQLGMGRITRMVDTVDRLINSCSMQNPRCYEVAFPKDDLIDMLRKSFGPRPAKGRMYFRAVRDHAVTRFTRILNEFPDTLVKCE